MIWNALQQLEVGQVGVFGFDMEPKLLHPLDAPLTESAGAALLQSLSFDHRAAEAGKLSSSSDFALLLDKALGYLDDCKAASSRSASGSSSELQQVGAVAMMIVVCSYTFLVDDFSALDRLLILQNHRNRCPHRALALYFLSDNSHINLISTPFSSYSSSAMAAARTTKRNSCVAQCQETSVSLSFESNFIFVQQKCNAIRVQVRSQIQRAQSHGQVHTLALLPTNSYSPNSLMIRCPFSSCLTNA